MAIRILSDWDWGEQNKLRPGRSKKLGIRSDKVEFRFFFQRDFSRGVPLLRDSTQALADATGEEDIRSARTSFCKGFSELGGLVTSEG